MTREQTKKARKVMQHFEDGGKVQARWRNHANSEWEDSEYPNWNWDLFEYRIKPQSIKMTEEERIHLMEQQPIPILDKKLGKTYFLPRYLINTLDANTYYILNPDTMEWEDWSNK